MQTINIILVVITNKKIPRFAPPFTKGDNETYNLLGTVLLSKKGGGFRPKGLKSEDLNPISF